MVTMKPWEEMTDREKNTCIAEHIMGWLDKRPHNLTTHCYVHYEGDDENNLCRPFDPLYNLMDTAKAIDKIEKLGWSAGYENRLAYVLTKFKHLEPTTWNLTQASTHDRCHAMYLILQSLEDTYVHFDIIHLQHDSAPLKHLTFMTEHHEFEAGLHRATLLLREYNRAHADKQMGVMYYTSPDPKWRALLYGFYFPQPYEINKGW